MIDRSLNYGRHLIERYLRQSQPFRTVLDIGAGQGCDLLVAQHLAADALLFAVETRPEFVRLLRDNGIGVKTADLERERLPFQDGSVDIVIANQVLEHVKEIFWIFHEISRVLRTRGRVIIGIPNLASFHNRILLLFGRQPTQIRTGSAHVRGFTKGDLTGFLEAAFPGGYRLITSGGSNFYPFPPFLAKPLANLFPGAAWGTFLLLEKQREYAGEFLAFPGTKGLETNFYLGER
jgi:SAM-dependent methyltransferase